MKNYLFSTRCVLQSSKIPCNHISSTNEHHATRNITVKQNISISIELFMTLSYAANSRF